ncbi:DUF6166 domain-containing protein [Nonomuraea polychroma]|uniref:DUF6166 domain-containing protein n=1 Tax=Nonomuraea polychroma TaxID=46176 RepID=UPI003D8B5397
MKLIEPSDVAPRLYRGWYDEARERCVIEVIDGEPTWRDFQTPSSLRVVRELVPDPEFRIHSFTWGYIGTGPLATAHAVLEDALGVTPDRDIRSDFCDEVVAFLCDYGRVPWLLSWRQVVRWAQSWASNARQGDRK